MSESIIKCQEEDIPLLFEKFKTVYRFNPRLQERDYFDWQFKYTPFSDSKEYTFWILWEAEKIKGFLGYVPFQFRYGGKIYEGGWTYNWYSFNKDASGLKLLTRFMNEFNHRFLIGLSLDSERIYELYRIPLLKSMPRWVAILSQKKVASLFEISNPDDLRVLQFSYESLMKTVDVSEIYTCERFNPTEEFTFDQWPSIKGYCRRTGKYLNWRYIDIPRHNYQAVRSGSGHQFAVYRIETIKEKNENAIRILEWSFVGKNAKQALAFIVREGIRYQCILIDFFCVAREIGSEIEKLGFFHESIMKTQIPYLFRPIHYAESIRVAIDMPPHRKHRTFNFNEWYITKGDSDIDRIKL